MSTASLSATLFGKSRKALLAHFYGHADEAFYIRQVARITGAGLGAVQRELQQLWESGILRRTVRGSQVYFQADSKCPIFPELKSIILKTVGIAEPLTAALTPLGKRVALAVVFGSVARGQESQRSDVDILVVGRASFTQVMEALHSVQEQLGRDVNPTVFLVDEFRRRLRKRDPFLAEVLAEPKIYLIGDELVLSRLVAKRLVA